MSESRGWTRREALGCGYGRRRRGAAGVRLGRDAHVSRKARSFRTILKDYAPEDLAGGATLFHEHMSFATDFMTRWGGYAAETRAANARRRAGAARPRRRRARGGAPPPAAPPDRHRLHAGRRPDVGGDARPPSAKASPASSTAGIPTWDATSTSCGRSRRSPACRSSPAPASTRSRSTRKRSRR